MKIGIDCRMFNSSFTGIGRYTFELVKHISKINKTLPHPHQIILFFNNPAYKGFKTSDLNIKKVLVNAKHYSYDEQTRFCRKLYKENLDIVHFPHFNIPILYRRPYIVTIHDLTLSLFPGQKMNKWYHRFAYHLVIKNAVKKAKKIIAVSYSTKEDLAELLKVNKEKIKVIYNGISEEFKIIEDSSKIDKTLKKYKIDKQFLLYTGVWRDHKNLPRLIKAFKILKNKNLDLQLVLTGKPDPHYPEVKNSIKENELENDIILPGLVDEDELIHLYNAALFYVFPSLYEGFGLPSLESMKCGTPVVASNTSSIPEICGEKNAVFFDPYDEKDIAEKIIDIYKDVDLQASLVEDGIRHAGTFSWEKMAKETFKLITCSTHSKNT